MLRESTSEPHADCDFAIRISGTRDNCRFSDGDIAYISQGADIKHGDYVVAKRLEGDYTISRVFDVDGLRVYVSACDDTDFAPVFDDNMPFEIVGKIVGVQFKT